MEDQISLQISRAAFSNEGPLPALNHDGDASAGVLTEITDFGDEILYDNTQEAVSQVGLQPALPIPDARASLQDQLFMAMQPPHDARGKRRFLPRGALARIVTEEAVRHELEPHLDESHDEAAIAELARKICACTKFPGRSHSQQQGGEALPRQKIRSFRKIFAILVLVGRPSSIVKFVNEDLNDSDLPLAKVYRNRDTGAFDLRRVRRAEEPLKCFSKSWTQIHIWNFEFWQWATLSPFFGKGCERKEVNHYRFPDSTVLPFVKQRQKDLEGGSGRIFKVDIHPEHHNFDLNEASSKSFAVKCLRSKDKETFKKEVEMLKRFSNDAHPHLISLLVTYQLSHTFFLVFPWAGGDLRKYWFQINPNPTLDLQTARWMAEQCAGIASGILEIHKYVSSSSSAHLTRGKDSNCSSKSVFGHHGDIKPENILWFPAATGGGTLRVSDFGLAEFGTNLTRRPEPQAMLNMTRDYRAPEMDLDGVGTFGYSFDIWALGCVYLEFAAWLLGGKRRVLEFELKRSSPDPYWLGLSTNTFFEVFKANQKNTSEARVKPTVKQFVDELLEDETCPEFLCEFLHMVRDEMVVLQPTNPRDLGRLCSRQIHYKLELMVRRCIASEKYASHPAPEKRTGYQTKVGPDFVIECPRICCQDPR
ncbi:kinase-like protein [Thozetella sp. PMI_491]|nr:kinase-like protein [Thozetella sp. PMI_491]